jgi:DNA helicase-2/ATP-dependent DNA helicase PcrA
MTTQRQFEQVDDALAALPREAVISIIAGAGTGKTARLTKRYVALLQADPQLLPEHIVVLTFTEKAATEMRARIVHSVTSDDTLKHRFSRLDMASARISTFHVFAATIALRHSIACNLDPASPFADEFEAQDLRDTLWKTFMEHDWQTVLPYPTTEVTQIAWDKDTIRETLHTIFADAKSRGEDAETFARAILPARMESAIGRMYVDSLRHLYRAYESALVGAVMVDLDDLIRMIPGLLTHYPAEYTAIRVVLVDEFQDTNGAQDAMMRAVTPTHHGRTPAARFVVGDPRQSIYLWRQAKPENLQYADGESPPQQRFSLRINYRSRKSIIDIANKSLKRYMLHDEPARKEFDPTEVLLVDPAKQIESDPTDTVIMNDYADAGAESRAIVQRVLELRGRGVQFESMAVLVRARSAARPIIDAFKKAGIPYDDGSLTPFFKIPLIIDAAHTLLSAAQPYTERSLTRTVWQATGTWDETTLAQRRAHARGVPLWQLLQQHSTETRVQNLINALTAGYRAQRYMPAATWARMVLHSAGVWERDGAYGQRLLHRFIIECVAQASTVDALVTDLTRAIEQGREVSAPERRTDSDTVSVMTVHAAKGLEFDAVFVPSAKGFHLHRKTQGMNYKTGALLLSAGDSPQMRDYNRQEQNEVIATFYVALTRAKHWLWVSSAVLKSRDRAFFLLLDDVRTQPIDGVSTTYVVPEQATADHRTSHPAPAIAMPLLESKPIVSLSPSSLSELSQCPRRYRYTRRSGLAGMQGVIGDQTARIASRAPHLSAYALPEPHTEENGVQDDADNTSAPTDLHGEGLDARILGTLFHRVCELHTATPVGSAQDLVAAAVGTIADPISAETVATCVNMTERFLASPLAQNVAQQILSEHHIRWVVERPRALVQFNGIIDRYDGVSVVDYKTDTEHDGIAQRHGDQLRLYGAAIASTHHLQQLPQLVLYHARSGSSVDVDNSQHALDETYQRLDSALEWIVRGSYPATPVPSSCAHCPAKWLCPEGRQALGERG